MPTDPSPLLVTGFAAAMLAWNVAMAGWIAARREAPSLFTQLTAFCGLLVIPTMLVGIAAGTAAGARTIMGITWLLPVVAVAFAVQVFAAMVLRLISPLIGVPLLLYDLAVVVVAIGDYWVGRHGAPPYPLQAAVAARDALVGLSVGRAALVSPLAYLAPILAPAYPARWRLSGLIRAVLVFVAAALTTLLLIEWPRAVGAVRSYRAAEFEPMRARPSGDFALGVRLFPVLTDAPSTRLIAANRSIVAAFQPEVVLLVLDPDAARPRVLDSLRTVLSAWQLQDATLAVALRLDEPRLPRSNDPVRRQAIERILQQLQPAVLFPALPDPIPGWVAPPRPSVSWWQNMIDESAAVIERVRPATRLGWSAARLDATDSAVYAWAASPESPVELLAATIYPSFSGLPSVDASLRTFERWHEARDEARDEALSFQTPHWLVTVGGLPHAHGERAQVAAIRRALAWGSRRDWITGAIVGEAGDYDGRVGLRAPDGRPRVALGAVGLAVRRMRAARAVIPTAAITDSIVADSLVSDSVVTDSVVLDSVPPSRTPE